MVVCILNMLPGGVTVDATSHKTSSVRKWEGVVYSYQRYDTSMSSLSAEKKEF